MAELFPEDKDLFNFGAVSYLGVPLFNAARQVIGHVVVFDDKPMPADPIALSVVEIFAARAGAELEREQARRWMIEGEGGAARILNLHPSTLRSRMRKLGIQRPRPSMPG